MCHSDGHGKTTFLVFNFEDLVRDMSVSIKITNCYVSLSATVQQTIQPNSDDEHEFIPISGRSLLVPE